MASTDKLIRIILKLDDQMSAGLDKSVNKLDKLGKKMSSVGKSMTMNITAPIVAIGAAMFKTFADFEAVMVEMEARTQATGAEMEAMSEAAINAGRDTVFSATEAAEAMLELTASGSSAREAIEQLTPVLHLAAAGGLDLGVAADGVTDVLNQFSLEAEHAEAVVNNLAMASGSSSATVSDLLQAFQNVGPVARQFGLSVQETSAALAVFAENGIKGSEAGTQLRSMLLNMTRDTERVSNAWDELGTSMFDAAGNVRDIDDVFDDINEAMVGMPMEDQIRLARDLGGSYGIMGFNSLRAADGIDTMMDTMRGATNAAGVADARMNTLSGRFSSMMGSLETLGIVMGGLGEGPLTDLIEWIKDVINGITAWAQENPKLAQTVLVVVAALATLGPILIILGAIISAVSTIGAAFASLAVIVPVLVGAFNALGVVIFFLTGPIGLIMIALTALGVFLIANKDKWGQWAESVGNSTKKAGNSMAEFGTKMNQGLSKAGIPVDKLSKNIEQMLIKFISGFKSLPDMLIGVLNLAVQAMTNIGGLIMQGLIQGFIRNAPNFLKAVQKIIGRVVKSVKSALQIRSPSRVMMDIGKQTVAGFNEGMDTLGGVNVGIPSAPQIGSALAPSLGLAGGGMTTQIFNIQAAPGTNDQQVLDISRKLAKLAQKRGARS